MLVLILAILPFASCNKTIEYLTKFGYINDASLTQDITAAVIQFQETFNLEPTGLLDNSTLKLMAEPRCGNKDVIRPFSALPGRRWKSSVITWYQYGTPQYSELIQKAFNVWEKHANITFKKDFKNPTIIISFSQARQHLFFSRQDKCYYDFDGPGSVIGHAYLPESSYNQTDIHLDSEENWDFSMDLPRYGNVSFFLTMVHEIGHALGLDHSGDSNSVMFPFERTPNGIASLNEFDLGRDDILAIQFLYGQPTNTSPTTVKTTTVEATKPTTSTSTTTTTTTTTAVPELVQELDICQFKNKINKYLIVNQKIFAFYQKYVWILSLNPSDRIPEEYKTARIITEWLGFLPQNFTEISGIYKRPNGNIVMFVGPDIFSFRYPALSLLARYSVNVVVGKRVNKVNTVFTTNDGKTLVEIDDWYLYEINECSFRGSFSGMISTILSGVPAKVLGTFKYINGMIYFITDSGVLEYNEFTNAVTRTLPDAFEVLQIPCVRETLLNKLYEVIKYLQ